MNEEGVNFKINKQHCSFKLFVDRRRFHEEEEVK
jgi:hypothetical protein